MKERLLTLAFAIGSLALFYVMFLHSATALDGRKDVARPLASEQRGNGYFAAAEWLRRAGVRVESLRERYTGLQRDRLAHPARGNLLLLTLPGVSGFKTAELRELDRWIRRGNTLLVAAALVDRPDWAFVSGGASSAELNLVTGLDFVPVDEQPAEKSGKDALARAVENAQKLVQAFEQPEVATLLANRPHPMFAKVQWAAAYSDYPARQWRMQVPYDAFVLALAHERSTGNAALWVRPLGAGRIIVAGVGSLFTNRALGNAGNAQLLGNIVSEAVAPAGSVIFDDYRQGIVASYDAAKFYRDGRLYVTGAVLLALWLAWVLGGTRLRTPQMRLATPRETDLVTGAGGFLARVLRPDAAARRLLENFFARLGARLQGPKDPQSLLSWLERHPRLRPADVSALRRSLEAAQGARRVRLISLQNLLAHIEGQVS
ncbi:MAG TPA: DUF4350 domain-containing protein [Steroidobacteraceae bacterium]